MNDITTIRPTIGLGNLRFGVTRDEVADYLGQPDRIETDGDAGDTHIMWYYDAIGGYVSFDEDDGIRLGTIETSSPEASIEGKCLIGISKAEALAWLSEIGEPREQLNDLYGDGDSRGCLFSICSHGLNLWFEDNVLTEVQWGYLLDENDEVVWPEVSEPAGAGQPATRPVDKPEGGDKPQPEAEGRRP